MNLFVNQSQLVTTVFCLPDIIHILNVKSTYTLQLNVIYTICSLTEKTQFTYKPGYGHGAYIRQSLSNRCARKEQSLLFDMFKPFNKIESSHKSDFFLSLKNLFRSCKCNNTEFPSNISIMDMVELRIRVSIWASATKSLENSRIFRQGSPEDE